MAGYNARQLEDALGKLWDLVEERLTDEDRQKLGIDLEDDNSTDPIFDELHCFGSRGPVGIGLGRFGGHAVGD